MQLKIYKSKNTIKEIIFSISYVILLVTSIITWTNISGIRINYAVINAVIALFLLEGIVQGMKMTIKSISLMFVLGIICMAVSYISANKSGLIVILLFILYGKDIDYHVYIQQYFIVCTILFIMILLLSMMGFIDSSYWVRYVSEGSGIIIRHSLGFKYTTYGPLLYMCIVFSYFAIKQKEINLIETAVILGTNYWMYYMTNTRAVYVLILSTVFMFWMKRLFPILFSGKLFRWLCIVSTPVLAFASIVLPILQASGNKWIGELDAIMSYRLRLGQIAIARYGLTSLFGHNIVWTGAKDDNLVDSSYLRILLEYGWIVLILIVIGFMIIQARNCHNGNYGLAIIIFLYLIHSFTDPQLLSLNANPFLPLLGTILNPTIMKNGISRFRHISKSIKVLKP